MIVLNKITKLAFFLLVFLYNPNIFAQNLYVEYSLEQAGGTTFSYNIISETSTFSFHIPEKSIFKTNVRVVESDYSKHLFLKDKKSNSLYTSETPSLVNNRLYVKDALHSMKWSLTNETKTILGKSCKSATTTFRGRTYKAFYTTEIKYSDGPWKFGGLPGLILEVSSIDGEYSWRVEKISENKPNDKKLTQTIAGKTIITWDDYVAEYKKNIDKLVARSKAQKDKNIQATFFFKISGIEIIYPEVQTGKGIEY